jgi:AbrB family looped-hinge helix DNA binding protein
MTLVRVSDKGQVTLPAEIRRKLGIKSGSRMEVDVRDDNVILKPEGSVMDAYGALHEYAKGDAEDWEAVRSQMEKSVGEEVTDAGKR